MIDQAQYGQEWLEKLLNLMGLASQVEISEPSYEDDSKACWLNIKQAELNEEQIETLIGPKGKTLDAIQYLANALVNLGQESDVQRAFTIELGDYRIRRQEELHTIATEVAEQVRETGQEQEIQSLSSAERRQIHNFLEKSGDLITESRGQEPDRNLVVRLRDSTLE
ncbi:MAG: R3H domain-containing nucleic acid-binding protein [Spirulinaceae cyanobacterium]